MYLLNFAISQPILIQFFLLVRYNQNGKILYDQQNQFFIYYHLCTVRQGQRNKRGEKITVLSTTEFQDLSQNSVKSILLY